jgi:glyoxylase-like metal-dependent hydrolase (beta-lactamase superfamily II)
MLGELNFSILHTPGHSPDSICWYLPDEQVLFSGDTLFKGSVGRTDLTAGDSRQLMASLTRLSGLPDQVRVYPGHGPATSVGQEKRSNFFLRKPGNVL